ncbi:MAG: hypothetical protein R8G66_22815 [Cytophagales bacterium]|nr:hypothetical protein [Cytophagales bacterium]
MRVYQFLILITFLSSHLSFAQEIKDLPKLKGPYLGQKPPGMVAEPFAPGVVSTEGWEVEGVFAPGMKEFYYCTSVEEPFQPTIIGYRQKGKVWKKYTEFKRKGELAFSPDGERMHMAKGYKDRNGKGWSDRQELSAVFQEFQIMRLTASAEETYAFDEAGMPDGDGIIRYSRMIDGVREDPKPFPEVINTGTWNAHPFIAPDESYLIWDGKREDGFGGSDLYISFRQADGSWGEAINMGDKVNTPYWDAYGSVTPDGKYLMFNRALGENYDNIDIYWIDAQIIETLRPAYNKPPENESTYEIAYAGLASGHGQVFVTDNDGQSKVQITDRAVNDGYPAWSPDGKRLAIYAYHDGRKTWSIHTLNRDGSDRKRLTHEQNKWDSAPAWSPDGKKIVHGRAYRDTEGAWRQEIWIMNADGSESQQLPDLDGGGPTFTPDGRIVFHSSGTGEICIANQDGSGLKQLTNNDAEEYHPEVSPDGNEIVFMSNRDGNHEIYVMNIDGSNTRRLTYNEVRDSTPTWSPDGSQILFTSRESEEERHLYLINKDGTGLRKFIEQGGAPAWLKRAQ